MTVPKKIVRAYLDQLDKMDGLERDKMEASIAGHAAKYVKLYTLLDREKEKLQELRVTLTVAASN